MFEEFIYDGKDMQGNEKKKDNFMTENFGADRAVPDPKVMQFQEFEVNRKSLSQLLSEQPSLDYLFSPFDPGVFKPDPFKETVTLGPAKTWEFEDLDTRDFNIINTLEKAEKKAASILEMAEAQARKNEEAARISLDKLESELKAAAEAKGRELAEKAQAEADTILEEARKSSEKLAGELARLGSWEQEATQIREELKVAQETNVARARELDEQRLELEQKREALLVEVEKDRAQARQEGIATGLEEGRALGRTEGLAKGYEEGLNKVSGLTVVLKKLDNIYRDLWSANAPMMIRLAVEAAQSMVNKEIQNGQGLATGAFNACVEFLQKVHEAVFRVRSEDLAELEVVRNRLRGRLDGLINISFQADDTLGPGDLIMESDAGRLDATLKTRCEKVMAVLHEAVDQGLVAEPPPAYGEVAAVAEPVPANIEPAVSAIAEVAPSVVPEVVKEASSGIAEVGSIVTEPEVAEPVVAVSETASVLDPVDHVVSSDQEELVPVASISEGAVPATTVFAPEVPVTQESVSVQGEVTDQLKLDGEHDS